MDVMTGKTVFHQVCKAPKAFAARLINGQWPKLELTGLKNMAFGVWTKLVGLYAAICACFRRPGFSEVAAVTAFGISAIGSITAVFWKKARKLMPLFGILAALGTAIVVLRCLFPRREG